MSTASKTANVKRLPFHAPGAEDRIAEADLGTKPEALSPRAAKQARDNIRDGIAVGLAATTTTPACRELAELAVVARGAPAIVAPAEDGAASVLEVWARRITVLTFDVIASAVTIIATAPPATQSAAPQLM